MDYPLTQPGLDLYLGKFTDGVPGVRPASVIPSITMNAVLDEVIAIITAAGMAPSEANLAQLLTALRSGSLVYGIDTGAANACVVAFTPAIGAPPDGMVLWFKAKTTNTGPTTLNAAPVVGAAHSALQGSEIVANGRCQVIWNATLGAWVLIKCTGGALQVAPSTQSGHAINLGQLVAVLGVSGYIKIPVSVAGVQRTLIVQWITPTVGASSTVAVTLPIPFPNGPLVAIGSSMVGGMTASSTPGVSVDVSTTQAFVQNTYSSSSLKIGALLIGW